MSGTKLVLASSSPRRRELLTTLGVDFCMQAADIDEVIRPQESPGGYVRRMASEKAAVVANAQAGPRYSVLGADTTVVVEGSILGKPSSMDEGRAMLTRLSGRWHSVITALCLQTQGGLAQRQVETRVHFASLTTSVCEAYLASDEPWDKAGGYGIQGLGGAFVREIRGSYSNVVGLPLHETWQLLHEHGISTVLSRP